MLNCYRNNEPNKHQVFFYDDVVNLHIIKAIVVWLNPPLSLYFEQISKNFNNFNYADLFYAYNLWNI